MLTPLQANWTNPLSHVIFLLRQEYFLTIYVPIRIFVWLTISHFWQFLPMNTPIIILLLKYDWKSTLFGKFCLTSLHIILMQNLFHIRSSIHSRYLGLITLNKLFFQLDDTGLSYHFIYSFSSLLINMIDYMALLLNYF